MKKILVTGGAGFIGSHLCKALVEKGETLVYSLDNYFTGSKNNHISNVTYINGDTVNIDSLCDFTPDLIYHLGEYSRVEQSFEDIDRVWKYNKDGTFAVLEFARKSGSKLVYAGSSTKFGDNGFGVNSSPYAWAKSSNTELVINYGNWYSLKYAITYFYNVYGPGEISIGRYATLIAIFKEKMKKGLPLTVVSPGSQKRNFTHIEDIINGLLLVGDNGFGDNYGIGSHEAFSILQIASMFGGEVNMLPERRGNRFDGMVVSKKTQSLGWKPVHSIEDYINTLKDNNWIDNM